MPSSPQSFKITKDNGLILYPKLPAAKDNIDDIHIPQSTTQGAGFGDVITDQARAFAAYREPISHKLTFGTADDMTEKWFTVNDPDTEEADPALDRGIQDAFSMLEFKKYFTEALAQAFIYGKSLMVCAFTDARQVAEFQKPLTVGAELKQVAVYPKTVNGMKCNEYTVEAKDRDVNSPRYGLPLIYKVDRGEGNFLFVHYSRCVEVDNGMSALDVVWDDVTCGRNIRWGTAQYMYRTGGGFPVISFPAGTTNEQLETWGESGAFNNLMSRTYIAIAQNDVQANTGMTFEFKGPAGSAIDPAPFYSQNIQQISIATGFPQADLIGAQAGAVTGSEVNQQNKYKVISRYQAKFEYVIRWFLDRLAESGQVKLIKSSVPATDQLKLYKRLINKLTRRDYRHRTAGQYVIEWNSAFELSEKDEAAIEYQHAQTQSAKLAYMSINEVRAEEGLDPLPDGAGEWKDQSDMFDGGEQFLVKSSTGMKAQSKPSNKQTSEGTEDFAIIDATEEGTWVTINGAHVLIKPNETAGEAFKRTTGKELSPGLNKFFTETHNKKMAALKEETGKPSENNPPQKYSRAYGGYSQQELEEEGPEEGYDPHGNILPSKTVTKQSGFTRNSIPEASVFEPTGQNLRENFTSLSKANQSMVVSELGWKESQHFELVMRGEEKATEEEMKKWAGIARKQKFVWQP